MWDQFEDDLDRFKEARDGDVWMSPFQCDTCHFVNIKKRGPDPATLGDKTLLDIIRRANLDAFWSRERSTVRANWLEGKRAAEILTDLGIEAPLGLHQRGPFPVEDTFGMVPAIAFLQRSLDPGRNAANVQFDTVRKLRTFYSNFYATTPPGALEANRPGSAGSEPLRGTPTNSPFFKRFLQGAHKRMGDLWIPDRALTIEQLLAAQDILEDEWTNLQGSVDQSRRYRVAATGCLITIGFSAALRGEELPKLDLEDIMRRWASATEHPTNPHCPIGLRGRFKGETGEKSHAMAVASTSASGVENGKWMERMLGFAVDSRIKSGPLFRRATKDGKFQKARVSDLDSLFHEILKKVQRAHPNLIEPEADVSEEFSVGRSLRRGGTSQARNQKVPEDVINTNNRWRNKENAKAKASKGSLLETYTDVLANLPLRLRFSQVL